MTLTRLPHTLPDLTVEAVTLLALLEAVLRLNNRLRRYSTYRGSQ
jgi:hypothetical protein